MSQNPLFDVEDFNAFIERVRHAFEDRATWEYEKGRREQADTWRQAADILRGSPLFVRPMEGKAFVCVRALPDTHTQSGTH